MTSEDERRRKIRQDFDDQHFANALVTIIIQRARVDSLMSPFIFDRMKRLVMEAVRLAETIGKVSHKDMIEQIHEVEEALRRLPTGEAFIRDLD